MLDVTTLGAAGDGITDDSEAFQEAGEYGGGIYCPKPSVSYLIGSPVTVKKPSVFHGDGLSGTLIERGYSPINDIDGVFTFQASECGLRDMTVRSKAGQSGGCLVSVLLESTGSCGQYSFVNCGFTTTGNDTHDHTIHLNGTARSTDPIGIRGVDFVGCHVFGAAQSIMLIKGVLKMNFGGGQIDTAGGSSNKIVISGTASVPSERITFAPSDNTAGFELDHCDTLTMILNACGNITNTANTIGAQGIVYLDTDEFSIQNNWNRSAVFNRYDNRWTMSDRAMRIGDTITLSDAGILQTGGYVSGAKSESVSHVGHIGKCATTEVANGKTFSFATGSAKMFEVSTGGGAACLVFADFKQSGVIILANPSGEFQASATPSSGMTGIFKSAENHTIYIKNNTGTLTNYNVLVLDAVNSVTDPT